MDCFFKALGYYIANKSDIGAKCIPRFGTCKIQTAKAKAANPAAEDIPCMHNIAMPWIMTTDIYTVRGESAITVESITFCPTGGMIKVVLSGQVGAGIVITGSDLMVAATSGMWAMVRQIAARSVPRDLWDDLMLASLAFGLLGAGNLSKTSEDTGNLKDSALGTVSGGMDYITARGAGALDMIAAAGDVLGELKGLETNFSENVNNAAVYASDGLTDIIEQFVEDIHYRKVAIFIINLLQVP